MVVGMQHQQPQPHASPATVLEDATTPGSISPSITPSAMANGADSKKLEDDDEYDVSKSRVLLREVNPHLVCVLCNGYFVDATSIAECLHSFCRSCIILYLGMKNYCPICEVQINNSKPHLSLKPDKTLQDIVYKLVPGLFHAEMKRRNQFYQDHPNRDMHLHPEVRGITVDRLVYSPQDEICLSLEYYNKSKEKEEWELVGAHLTSTNNKSLRSLVGKFQYNDEVFNNSQKKYLKCPASVRVTYLKKFIKQKYELQSENTVELFYRRESLPDDYSLMDIAYIYAWKRNNPMQLYYRISKPVTVSESGEITPKLYDEIESSQTDDIPMETNDEPDLNCNFKSLKADKNRIPVDSESHISKQKITAELNQMKLHPKTASENKAPIKTKNGIKTTAANSDSNEHTLSNGVCKSSNTPPSSSKHSSSTKNTPKTVSSNVQTMLKLSIEKKKERTHSTSPIIMASKPKLPPIKSYLSISSILSDTDDKSKQLPLLAKQNKIKSADDKLSNSVDSAVNANKSKTLNGLPRNESEQKPSPVTSITTPTSDMGKTVTAPSFTLVPSVKKTSNTVRTSGPIQCNVFPPQGCLKTPSRTSIARSIAPSFTLLSLTNSVKTTASSSLCTASITSVTNKLVMSTSASAFHRTSPPVSAASVSLSATTHSELLVSTSSVKSDPSSTVNTISSEVVSKPTTTVSSSAVTKCPDSTPKQLLQEPVVCTASVSVPPSILSTLLSSPCITTIVSTSAGSVQQSVSNKIPIASTVSTHTSLHSPNSIENIKSTVSSNVSISTATSTTASIHKGGTEKLETVSDSAVSSIMPPLITIAAASSAAPTFVSSLTSAHFNMSKTSPSYILPNTKLPSSLEVSLAKPTDEKSASTPVSCLQKMLQQNFTSGNADKTKSPDDKDKALIIKQQDKETSKSPLPVSEKDKFNLQRSELSVSANDGPAIKKVFSPNILPDVSITLNPHPETTKRILPETSYDVSCFKPNASTKREITMPPLTPITTTVSSIVSNKGSIQKSPIKNLNTRISYSANFKNSHKGLSNDAAGSLKRSLPPVLTDAKKPRLEHENSVDQKASEYNGSDSARNNACSPSNAKPATPVAKKDNVARHHGIPKLIEINAAPYSKLIAQKNRLQYLNNLSTNLHVKTAETTVPTDNALDLSSPSGKSSASDKSDSTSPEKKKLIPSVPPLMIPVTMSKNEPRHSPSKMTSSFKADRKVSPLSGRRPEFRLTPSTKPETSTSVSPTSSKAKNSSSPLYSKAVTTAPCTLQYSPEFFANPYFLQHQELQRMLSAHFNGVGTSPPVSTSYEDWIVKAMQCSGMLPAHPNMYPPTNKPSSSQGSNLGFKK